MRPASPFAFVDGALDRADHLRDDPAALAAAWPRAGLIALDETGLALADADALVIVTEWKEFRSPDFEAIKAALKNPLIFDGRNLYDPKFVRGCGIEYFAIGR